MLRNGNIKKTSAFHYLLINDPARALELQCAYYRQPTSPWISESYRSTPRGYYVRSKLVEMYKDWRGKRAFREYGTCNAQLYMQTSQFNALEFRNICSRFSHAVKCYATKERCADDIFFCIADLLQAYSVRNNVIVTGIILPEELHEKHTLAANGAD